MSRTTDAQARAARSLAVRRGGAGGRSLAADHGSGRFRPRSRRPHPAAVLASALGLFLTLLALLAWQMRGGGDPALGAGTRAAPPPRPQRVVVVHRVVRRVVVVHKPAPAAAAPPPAAS
ncbi:MAG: hypothetical protein JSS99_06970, partial [Actinobacteria bacterium]|nr:hypothetical protein [Actinomycetota bacterium]